MQAEVTHIYTDTTGKTDIIDLTPQVNEGLQKSGITSGTVTLFVPGSTTALTTIEYANNRREVIG